jgi:ATP-binding cassette subfamily C (CFTR/MRP) protein 1
MGIGYVVHIPTSCIHWIVLIQIPVDKTGKYCLAHATYSAFQTTFWAAVIPRLCFTGFSFAQPFLINTIVDVVGASSPENSKGVVGGLIGATALVYLGLAVC